MSFFKMDSNMYNNLLKLFRKYYFCENVSVDEFIEMQASRESYTLDETETKNFVAIVTHKDFLTAVKTNFVTGQNLRNYNDVGIIMVIFVILFGCDQMNCQELFELFKSIKCAFKRKLLQYFCNEDNLIQTALTGCKYFEDEYILNRIINPILHKIQVLKEADELLYQEKMYQRMGKPPTIPDHMNVLRKKTFIPMVPLNTPVESVKFGTRKIPKTLYQCDNVDKKLMLEFEKNKLKAKKLLEQAKALDKNYCKPKQPVVLDIVSPPQFKAKKAPSRKSPVEIKRNVATVLREASLCIRQQEKEIKDIETMIQGGSTLDQYKELEENVRNLEQEKSLEEIEKKHISGLLTFEEAILAKRKLIQCNKERFKKFMEERENFLKLIEEWKEKEQEKMRLLVKKGVEIERRAKESEKNMKEKKKNKVDQFKEETRRMMQEAYDKRQEEIAKKVKLIQEIKTLHQLKSLHPVKGFDPTECPNLGLLCQMSIADLQQQLTDIKIKMEEELQQKRKCIQKYKERQRKMIQNVKNFITQTRMSKPKQTTVPIRPTKLAQSPDLDKLRGQLEYARKQRKYYLKLDNIPCPNIRA